jgi:hypothetical protein
MPLFIGHFLPAPEAGMQPRSIWLRTGKPVPLPSSGSPENQNRETETRKPQINIKRGEIPLASAGIFTLPPYSASAGRRAAGSVFRSPLKDKFLKIKIRELKLSRSLYSLFEKHIAFTSHAAA